MRLRVVLAEDNYLLREGLAQLLSMAEEVDLVAICSDLPELDRAIEGHDPDVVITDIRMPPTGTDEGIRLANRMRSARPQLGVVVLSQYAEPEYVLALLENGAAGRAYLLKERVSEIEQLLSAVREVARGGSVIDPAVVEALVTSRAAAKGSALAELTPRETEVLSKVAEGRNNAGIAATLSLTDRAVEKHINAIFSKLGLSEEPDTHHRVKAALLYLAEQRH
ncbi:MAG: response regulator transcription factor [Candidatus Dormibacteraeota bacterium]|uniref:Response regulator transcription factor n=1 Tax=Candidatus Amunia macphersoniae TaxID=3127014 RepID=A0A934NGX9_9BACT|nr:response regulator transcription factor [Candidatus Dormibacteraeota bacterium]